MSKHIDYRHNFLAFRRDLCPVEGSWGPTPIILDWQVRWYELAFPPPEGNPGARNIMDCRTKKQGKSSDAGAVALYMATRQPYAEVVIAAADKNQAMDRVLRAAKFAVENGPLSKHAKVYRDVIEFDNNSVVQAIPSDWRGSAGGNYDCIIFDELHTAIYENSRRLFDELLVPPSKSSGARWVCSYAGWLGTSELLWEWWQKALAGQQIQNIPPIYRNTDVNLLALIDIGSESWRMPWSTPDYMRETEAAERPNTFRRIWLNEWVSPEDQFVTKEEWDACYSEEVKVLRPGDDRKIVLGIDAATHRDLTAAVGTWYNPETEVVEVCFVRVWKPIIGSPKHDKPRIDLEFTVGDEVLRLAENKQIKAVVADSFQMHTLMLTWERAGIEVIEFPQTAARVEADQALYDAILGKTIAHFGHPELTQHVLNAVARETPRGFRLDKSKTSLKIDAAVALSMSHQYTIESQFKPRWYSAKFMAVTSQGIIVGGPEAPRGVSPQRAARILQLHKDGVSSVSLRRRFSLNREEIAKILEGQVRQ